MKTFFLNTVRRVASGEPAEQFRFAAPEQTDFLEIRDTDCYIHIPFCPNQCKFCPYNTVPYDGGRIGPFFELLLREAEGYRQSGMFLEGNSLYIGGGTPCCCRDELFRFLEIFKQSAGNPAEIAIELHPSEITPGLVAALKAARVTQISLGVQSFGDNVLEFLGRSYRKNQLPEAISLLRSGQFDNFNLDLIFGSPVQTGADFRNDLIASIDSGATQITAYPFFHFSFVRAKGNMKMLPLARRKRFYDILWETMTRHGWEMSSVWSFQKPGAGSKFSSVSRRNFIGLGPGSASKTADVFRFNTFDLDSWMRRCGEESSPVAVELPLSPNLEALYHLYWLFYAGKVPRDLSEYPLKRARTLKMIFHAMRKTGMLRPHPEDPRYFTLTRRGAFWGHLLQNYYIIGYIDRLWGEALNNPFPPEVML